MSKGLHRFSVIVGVVVLATITIGPPLAAAPAQSAASATDGAAAACAAVAVGPTMVRLICTLTDTTRDGDSVYVAWRTTSGGVHSLYNHRGAGDGITVAGYAPTAKVALPHRVVWKVCRDRQALWTDNCSDWRGEWAALPS